MPEELAAALGKTEMEIDFQTFELQFGLIFTIIGSIFFGSWVAKPGSSPNALLWQVSMGLLTAVGVALVWAGIT